MIRFPLFAAFLALSLSGCSSVAEPAYSVVKSEPPFELRDYAPMIVAETRVQGDWDEAGSAGFRVLADFIFGNNTSRAEIAMTAPVTQTRSEKIAMTAPVTQTEQADGWMIGFVMPAGYTMATLPIPNDPRVKIREVPARRVAVAVYSGVSNESVVQAQTASLQAWISRTGLVAAGPATVARYDPPWTLPMLRRNEVHIEVKP